MHLLRSVEAAQREGFVLGVKLVRGAYHPQEHKRISPYEPDVKGIQGFIASAAASNEGFPAQKEGPKPPVWDEKWETDAAYNAAASLLLGLLNRPEPPVSTYLGCS